MNTKKGKTNWYIFDIIIETNHVNTEDKHYTAVKFEKILVNLIDIKYVALSSTYMNGYRYEIVFGYKNYVNVFSTLAPEDFYKYIMEIAI